MPSKMLTDSDTTEAGTNEYRYAKIDDCPLEVLQMVLRELDGKSRLKCSLVSHFWRDAVTPLVFSHIRLRCNDLDNVFIDDEQNSNCYLQTALRQAATSLAPWVRGVLIWIPCLEAAFVHFVISLFPALESLILVTTAFDRPRSMSSFVPVHSRHSIWNIRLMINVHTADFARILGLLSHVTELVVDTLTLCKADCCSAETTASQIQIQSLVLPLHHTTDNNSLEFLLSYMERTALTSIVDRSHHGSLLDVASRNSQFYMVDTITAEMSCDGSYDSTHSVISAKGGWLASFPRLSTLHLVCNNTEQCLPHMRVILQPLPLLRKLKLTLRFPPNFPPNLGDLDDLSYGMFGLEDTCLDVENLEETFGGMQWQSLSDGIACHASSLESLDLCVYAMSQDSQEEVEKSLKALLPTLCSSSRRVQQLCTVTVVHVPYYHSGSDDDNYPSGESESDDNRDEDKRNTGFHYEEDSYEEDFYEGDLDYELW